CCRLAITPISASDSAANASLRAEMGPRSEINSRILARFLPPCSYNAETRFPEAWPSWPRLSSCPAICVRSCTTVPEPAVPAIDHMRHELHQEHPERINADGDRDRVDDRGKDHRSRAAVQQFADAEIGVDAGRQRENSGGEF